MTGIESLHLTPSATPYLSEISHDDEATSIDVHPPPVPVKA